MRGYVQIDLSPNRRRIIVSLLEDGTQKLRKFPMRAKIDGGMNILISTHHRGFILLLQ
jgi:hypothetical protein